MLSDDPLRFQLFPYAKIECARFKGTVPGNFIDQKTIDSPLGLQAEEAYKFVLRHISQGSQYEGVYRKDRWEYPVIAIREAIRNKTLAPVFKKLGIIEQWGNGLQLIADEMKNYPEIALQWKEPGMAFRVSFIKKELAAQHEPRTITDDNGRVP